MSDPDVARLSTRKEFGAALTAVRAAAGLSIREVARKAGVTPGTVSGWFAGNAAPAPDEGLRDLAAVLRACGVAEPDIAQWKAAANRIRATTRPARPGHCPYRGLEPYRSADAAEFFGRADIVGLLRDRVELGLSGAGPALIGLLGSSGSGKSSLLQAGLVPQLTDAAVVVTPGADPVSRLDRAVAAVDRAASLVIVVDQAEELWTYESGPDADWPPRDGFLQRLAALTTDRRAVVVFSLRADFFERAAQYPLLGPALTADAILLGPMDADQLRAAVTEPACAAGVLVHPTLVELLLQELAVTTGSGAHDPGALPLLSHALYRSWTQRTTASDKLTIEHYRKTGGIHGAVKQSADEVWLDLEADATAAEATRRIFTRAVLIGDTGLARRVVTAAEWEWDDIESDVVRAVVDRYVAARLLTTTADGVQISHEALIHSWPRLAAWIEADRDSIVIHRRLATAAAEWARNRSDSALLTAGMTEEFREWVRHARNAGQLTSVERTFLDECTRFHTAAAARDRQRTTRLRVAVAALAVAIAVLACAVTITVRMRITADTTRDAAVSRQAALQSQLLRDRDPALAQQLALAGFRISDTVEARSALLDSTAIPTPRRIPTAPGPRAAASTADGSVLAVGTIDGHVHFIERRAATAALRTTRHRLAGAGLAALALRPTAGRLLAVGGADGLSLWALGRDGATPGRRPLPPQPPGLRVRALSWSQSGDQLAAATDRGLMEWTVAADGRATPRPTSGASRDVRSVTWSGPVLITAAGRDVTVADRSGTALPDRTLTLGDDDGDIESVVADPAAATLALITSRRRVLLVDTAGPAPTPIGRVLTGGQATAAAFDSTGATLVVGHEDGTVQPFGVAALRRADMSAAPGRPWTSPGSVASIGFTDSDRSMAVVHEDGTVRRWSLPGPVTAPADSEYTGFRADAEGTVAGVRKRGTPGRDDELHLFDLSDGARESAAPLTIGPDGPTREPMTVSGDGTVAATATRSGEIRLWPIGLRPGFAPRSPVTLPLNGTGAIALTHDGKLLAAAASGDRRIVLVDLSAGAGTPTVIDAGGRVASVEFGASGALLAAGVGDGVRMWDVAAGRPPAPVTDIAGLAGSPGTITLIRLSPDGSTLAAGGSDGTVHLVDVTRPGRAARLSSVRVPLGPIQSITFNRKATRLVIGADVRLTVVDIKDRRRPSTYAVLGAGQTAGYLVDASYGPHETSLTAAGTRGSLHTWRTDAESVADRLCADSLSAVTAQEWRIYLPDTRYRNPCS